MLLRHAKSGWKDNSLRDFDRPLKKKGKQTAKLVGKLIAHSGYQPDIVLSSPAKRAKKTAKLVKKHSHHNGPVHYVDTFYMGQPGDYIHALRSLSDEINSVMLVGHNPGMEDLLCLLAGKFSTLSTGALAILELELSHWSDFSSSTVSKLIQFVDPEKVDLQELEVKMAKASKDKEKAAKKE
jgi:phosphohistidine phosphatase